jgi:hypothetical protein
MVHLGFARRRRIKRLSLDNSKNQGTGSPLAAGARNVLQKLNSDTALSRVPSPRRNCRGPIEAG